MLLSRPMNQAVRREVGSSARHKETPGLRTRGSSFAYFCPVGCIRSSCPADIRKIHELVGRRHVMGLRMPGRSVGRPCSPTPTLTVRLAIKNSRGLPVAGFRDREKTPGALTPGVFLSSLPAPFGVTPDPALLHRVAATSPVFTGRHLLSVRPRVGLMLGGPCTC